jgi:hypothetical protein
MLETFLSSPDAEMEARYTGAPHAVVDIGTFKRVSATG